MSARACFKTMSDKSYLGESAAHQTTRCDVCCVDRNDRYDSAAGGALTTSS